MSTPASPRSTELLRERARAHGEAPALRHKRRGLWLTISWRELADEVDRYARGLGERGFRAGDELVLLGHVRPRALVAALAAQSAGGTVVPVDPGEDVATLAAIAFARGGRARHFFVEDDAQRERLAEVAPEVEVATYEDVLAAGDAALGRDPRPQPRAPGDAPAWAFHDSPGPRRANVTHAELLAAAEVRVAALALADDDEALVTTPATWRPVALAGLTEWLVAGLVLSTPETAASVATDARELEPSVVFASATSWRALHDDTQARLPTVGSARRRLVDWSLAGGGARRALGALLVRRPLRRALGFARLRVAVTVAGDGHGSDALGAAPAAFYAALGVPVRLSPSLHALPLPAPAAFVSEGAPLARRQLP